MSADGIKVLKKPLFDKSRWMQMPRDILIGHGAIEQLPKVCEDLHLGKSALIIAGENTMKAAGGHAQDLLSDNYSVDVFTAQNISLETIKNAENAAVGFDFILGVGGGKAIDLAKIVSYNLDCQFISVPTAASHDGIASSRASVPTAGGSVSMDAHPPHAVVADTEIIAKAPHKLMASGCADIISNHTAILDWELSHRVKGEPISEYAAALSKMTADILVKNAHLIYPGSEEGAWIVIKALVSSGVAMSIAGSSRPASGAEHKFSHALDILSPDKGLHGEQCGIGSIMTMYLHGGDWREIRKSLTDIGAPTTPKELGIDDETAVEALMMAKTIRPERFTILDMGLEKDCARKLVKMLYKD
ncbi:MAG: NAD(P)-dependent glycerol-1-phosphate dehydrogenase [Methanomicrobium sp.]|nr:NAD(P)-dependent glycerol-1-phosphate dehydrogenase [Methanomicrobium sp.]MDD4299220.1 NAD(P)-dependent glycerol-1-phosphate dehydrogenase [Methanomicrobium sp.]